MILVVFSVVAKTPYHSVNTNCYRDVVQALKRPAWLANYSEKEFTYINDTKQFGERDYWQSPQEMFARKKGDCEDFTAFHYAVLKEHDYNPEAYIVLLPDAGHALCIFQDKGSWWTMDYSIFGPYDTQKKAVNGGYFSLSDSSYMWEYTVRENDYTEDLSSRFIGKDRLALDAHLTECQPGRLYFYSPLPESYPEALHKQAIGYLWPTDFKGLKGIGLGVSDHGFYSSTFTTNERVFSLYLLCSNVGVSLYTGSYQGIDLDWKVFSNSLLDYRICLRNFSEVIDHQVKFSPLKQLDLGIERNDQDFRFTAMVNWEEGNIRMGTDSRGGTIVGIGPLTLIGSYQDRLYLSAALEIEL